MNDMKDIVQNLNHLADETAGKLEWLAEFGKDSEGGVSRLLYSKEWVEGQHALKEWIVSEGWEARFDEIGNLFGTFKGTNSNETILTGSHVDTVKNGGSLDGAYGIVAGMLALTY